MAKPFMCGDEPATYIPAGGCDCNYTIQEYERDDETQYKLLNSGEQAGDTIVVPKVEPIEPECYCDYSITDIGVQDPDLYVAQYALVKDGIVEGDLINVPKQSGGGGGDCNCNYAIAEGTATSSTEARYRLLLDGTTQKGSWIDIPKYPNYTVVQETATSSTEARYRLMLDGTTQKGAWINIPKYPSPEIVDTRYYTAVSSDPDHPDVHTWVKYSNGVAVEYRTINIPATAGSQVGSSNIYMEKTEGRLWATGLFVASPTAVANCYWTNGSCWCNISACTSTEFSVILFKLNTTNARAIVRVQAMGRWKTIS